MINYISRLYDQGDAPAFPRRVVVLGATGSIGASTLAVMAEHPGLFSALALAGGRNLAGLAEAAARFRPPYLAILEPERVDELRGLLPAGYAPTILAGPSAYDQLAGLPEADAVLVAIVGAAGLSPTLSAVRAGKLVALATKEALVLAGDLVRAEAARSGAVIIPVDSEHNALFQALCGHDGGAVRKLVLTASGGPFRGADIELLRRVTPAMALKHPTWSMGARISVDSATLMNKGLEVIEACHLYGLPQDKVEVLVHPQSVVHALVDFHDASVLAHLGPTDMRVAIASALAYPDRIPLSLAPLDLAALSDLHFEHPDTGLFPCLRLARQAFEAGMGATVVLNAAGEVAVERFLTGDIPFLGIPALVEAALAAHNPLACPDLDTILYLDEKTRRESASRVIRPSFFVET